MNKKIVEKVQKIAGKQSYFFLGAFAAFALLVTGLTAASAFELEERFEARFGGHHEALEEAVESGDYNAWKAIVEEHAAEKGKEPKVLDVITQDNFSKLAELHELMEEGNTEEAKVIAEELGLPKHKEKFKNGGKGFEGRAHLDSNGDGVCDLKDMERGETSKDLEV